MSKDQTQILVRLPAEMHEAIKARAAAEDRSMASTVRRALRQYVDGAPLVDPAPCLGCAECEPS